MSDYAELRLVWNARGHFLGHFSKPNAETMKEGLPELIAVPVAQAKAAPALLEALDRCADALSISMEYELPSEGQAEEATYALDIARTAIAKARGEVAP